MVTTKLAMAFAAFEIWAIYREDTYGALIAIGLYFLLTAYCPWHTPRRIAAVITIPIAIIFSAILLQDALEVAARRVGILTTVVLLVWISWMVFVPLVAAATAGVMCICSFKQPG